MAEIINQIPGFEKGRVQRISATDEVSESFIVAQMAADLHKKWNTSVLCISLDDHKEAIDSSGEGGRQRLCPGSEESRV